MADRFPRWISLEEHGLIGGLGSALLEWLATRKGVNVRLKRLGVPDTFLHKLGNQAYTRSQLGLDAEGLMHTLAAELSRSE
jgi:transketolase C-terminal domain/subunit